MDEQSGEWEEGEVIDEGIGELEMEELIPEWGWRRYEGVYSRDQMKNNEMIDELLFREDDVGGGARVTTDEVKYT